MVIINVERFEALIFDLDGVITDTASLHARAWKRLFDEILARRATETGVEPIPFDLESDYRRYVDGKPRLAGLLSFLAARGIDVVVGAPGDPAGQETAHELAGRKDRYFTELLAQEGVQVIPRAEPLLREARSHGMRTAVVSSSRHCEEILRVGRLSAFFDARVDGVDLDRLGLKGKPAPDMFLEAARRLGVRPACAVVFEDAAAGVAAARAGGFGFVVGIGRNSQVAALFQSGADQVEANLREVNLQGYRPATSKRL